MQPEKLDVFDFDGTLIRINSFREITKKFSIALLKKFKVMSLLLMVILYVLRICGFISHFRFKQRIVEIFEKSLNVKEKCHICQTVFDDNVNKSVFNRMVNSNNCIISTAAPFAYISRMSLGKDIPVISALDSTNRFPDASNYGAAKIANLKAYFNGKDFHVVNFVTDNDSDDRPLIDLATNAFIVKGDRLTKIK